VVILFTYYRDDAITRAHHALLCRHNPGAPVVPLVANGAADFLPGTVDVGPLADPWYHVDRFPARWFDSPHRIESERYVVLEHDTRATMPIVDYFAPVWRADVAGSIVATPEDHPGWIWWRDVPPHLWEHRTGVLPSGVVLYSRRALECLARSRESMFAEVHIGTVCRAAGLTLAVVPGGLATVACSERDRTLSDRPGVYHPVKRIEV
jgi:hypothetical protein